MVWQYADLGEIDDVVEGYVAALRCKKRALMVLRLGRLTLIEYLPHGRQTR